MPDRPTDNLEERLGALIDASAERLRPVVFDVCFPHGPNLGWQVVSLHGNIDDDAEVQGTALEQRGRQAALVFQRHTLESETDRGRSNAFGFTAGIVFRLGRRLGSKAAARVGVPTALADPSRPVAPRS